MAPCRHPHPLKVNVHHDHRDMIPSINLIMHNLYTCHMEIRGPIVGSNFEVGATVAVLVLLGQRHQGAVSLLLSFPESEVDHVDAERGMSDRTGEETIHEALSRRLLPRHGRGNIHGLEQDQATGVMVPGGTGC